MRVLYNKLIRTDLILAAAIVLAVALRQGFAGGVFEGMAFATAVISMFNHVDHYRRTKKLY